MKSAVRSWSAREPQTIRSFTSVVVERFLSPETSSITIPNMSEKRVSGADSPLVIDNSGSGGGDKETAESVRKQDSNWEPYEGPRGGSGWRNTETDEVVYSEVSPAGDTFDEDEGVGTAEPGEDDETDTSNVPESAVSVDRSDVESTDYISIDGEKEGFVDSVERRGDDVYVRFDDGDGLWLEEDMEVFVDDDPPEKSDNVEQVREYTEKIRDSVTFEERSPTSTLTQREIRDTMADSLTRVESEDIAENTIDRIGDVKSLRGRSHYDPHSGNISIAPNDFEKTVVHEVGHAILDSNGFETDDFASIISMGFDRSKGIDASIFSMTKGEVARKLEREGEISEGISEKIRERFDSDMVVSPNDLTFKPDTDFNEDFDEGLADFVATLNSTYTDVIADLQYENDPVQTITREDYESIKGEYEWTNANEFFAMIHENLQQEGINRNNIEKIYDQYPEVLDAYFDVFEPNDLQKRELNQLFNESGGSGPIESEPFPEVQE